MVLPGIWDPRFWCDWGNHMNTTIIPCKVVPEYPSLLHQMRCGIPFIPSGHSVTDHGHSPFHFVLPKFSVHEFPGPWTSCYRKCRARTSHSAHNLGGYVVIPGSRNAPCSPKFLTLSTPGHKMTRCLHSELVTELRCLTIQLTREGARPTGEPQLTLTQWKLLAWTSSIS